jgi:hypothetical protein
MIVIPDEIIIFATLDAIAIIWMVLRILVNHWIGEPVPFPPTPHHTRLDRRSALLRGKTLRPAA